MQTQTTPGRHAHRANGTVGNLTCPTCEQPVSREKYVEIEGKLRTRDAEIERVVASRFGAKEASIRKDAATAATAAANAKLAKIEREKKVAEQKAQTAVSETKRLLEAQRKLMERLADERVAAERERHGAEKATFEQQKAALEGQLVDMQRKLASRTAHQLGDPPEVDLYDTIRAAFGAGGHSTNEGDRVSRVPKGKAGPDIIIEVMHMGVAAGRIIIDSKNHSRWSSKFVSKLRADQRALSASFALLSSNVMPAGRKLLHVQDAITICDPALVIPVLTIIRQQVIDHHRLKLTVEVRNEKADDLFRLILSPTWADWFNDIAKLTDDMTNLEKADAVAYGKTSAKRFAYIASLHGVYEAMALAISHVINGESTP